jgi:hypothetical protein
MSRMLLFAVLLLVVVVCGVGVRKNILNPKLRIFPIAKQSHRAAPTRW